MLNCELLLCPTLMAMINEQEHEQEVRAGVSVLFTSQVINIDYPTSPAYDLQYLQLPNSQ